MLLLFIVTLFFLNILFFAKFKNLLFILILLEMIGFVVIMYFLSRFSICVYSYTIVILLFVFFVVEGVLGIIGLVLIISRSGVDYLGMSVQRAF